MNQTNRRGYYVPLYLAVISLTLCSCVAGGRGEQRPPSDGHTPPIVNVPNLHLLAPDNLHIGVAVAAGRPATSILKDMGLQSIVTQHFNQITAENIMKPSYLHPAENRYFFDHADALVAYAASHDKTVHGHTLVWHNQLANWMNEFSGDADDWSEMMADHITKIVSRYAAADTVVSWDVLNEVFADIDADKDGLNDLRKTVWLDNIGPGYLAAAYRAAHAADPNAELYYNDYNISGIPAKLSAVLEMVERFKYDPNPVPIHGIAFQMHINATWPDINQIRIAFARAASTGLKVKISELDIPMNTDRAWKPLRLKAFTDAVAVQQQERFEAIVTAYMDEVPAAQRGGISVWGVADSTSWLRRYNPLEWPLLFNDDLDAKPALQGFAEGLTGHERDVAAEL